MGDALRYTGTMRFVQKLSGGVWTFETDEGRRFQLMDPEEALLVDGARVELEAEQARQTLGIGMVGAYLRVASWRRLDAEPEAR